MARRIPLGAGRYVYRGSLCRRPAFVFVEGSSRREAARVFGLSRETVLKMCRFSLPPGYTRSKHRREADIFTAMLSLAGRMAANMWHCSECNATPIDVYDTPFWKAAETSEA